ncbi:MAG: NAD-dependent epimerase/dehydratase family protein [Candidatus Pacebacteria bacterium]|nr:NAD-dependent epimerase/dehydratase family protein [Candidatus Paceibacterota bacterium]
MINPSTKLAGKTVLITGGAGFIGSHLCDKILGYGGKVICFDDLSTGSKAYVESQKDNKNFTFIKGDVNKLSDIHVPFLKHRIDYVLHYAALVGVQRTIDDPLSVLIDIDGIKNILDLSHKHGVKKIVYASSSEVYGNQEKQPLHEDESYLNTRIPYAVVKMVGEHYLQTYWETVGLPYTALRFFNVYGPRQESSRYGFVVGVFISQILQGKKPTIFHDGSQTRDFMYVEDNVEAAIQALINEKANGHAINLGHSRETSILELAKMVAGIAGRKDLEPELFHERALAEIKRRVADNRKMLEILEYIPKHNLESGLKLTFDWYKQNPKLTMSDEKQTFKKYSEQVWIPRDAKETDAK